MGVPDWPVEWVYPMWVNPLHSPGRLPADPADNWPPVSLAGFGLGEEGEKNLFLDAHWATYAGNEKKVNQSINQNWTYEHLFLFYFYFIVRGGRHFDGTFFFFCWKFLF